MWPFGKKEEEQKVFGRIPSWASVRVDTPNGMPWVDVQADSMYKAWIRELREFYSNQKNWPGHWLDPDGKLKPEWSQCLQELNGGLTAYWLEVAYQCGKLELQVAMGFYTFEIRIHDSAKRWAQKKFQPGRGADMASGGVGGAQEAREHFRRIRKVLPA